MLNGAPLGMRYLLTFLLHAGRNVMSRLHPQLQPPGLLERCHVPDPGAGVWEGKVGGQVNSSQEPLLHASAMVHEVKSLTHTSVVHANP